MQGEDWLILSFIIFILSGFILLLLPKRTWGENPNGIGQIFKKDKKWKN